MGKRSDGFERRPRGFYPTPWAAFEPLAPHLSSDDGLADPCAGDRQLLNHLAKAKLSPIWGSDIEPQAAGIIQYDARTLPLECTEHIELFVTNPPWPEKGGRGEPTLAILYHLISLRPTWALLPSDFMHNVYAADLMRLCSKIVSVGRVQWIPGSEHTGYDNAAWYLFDQRHEATAIEFVPRQAKRRAA